MLAGTLVACDAVEVCAADAPGSAVTQYDAFAAQLAGAPETYDFPLADGTTEERELTLEELQSAAAWSMSDPWSREQFQQALNAAAEDNDVPLARIAALSAGADAETGAVHDDPTFSGALYYAVQCADYDVVPQGSTGRAELDVWLAAAGTAGIDQRRLGALFYQDLPCLFWPETGATPAPAAAVTDPPYPLLALTVDTDPNTPTQQAERVFSRTAGDAALVVQQGGPHVVYGRGEACVDDAVETLLATGRLAVTGVTVCPGARAGDWYWPNAPAITDGYTEAGATVDDLLDATLGNVGFGWWDGTGELTIGCDAGGTAQYDDFSGDTLQVTLDACAWTPQAPVDGELTVTDGGAGDATGSVELPFAELDFDEGGELTGTFRGTPVG